MNDSRKFHNKKKFIGAVKCLKTINCQNNKKIAVSRNEMVSKIISYRDWTIWEFESGLSGLSLRSQCDWHTNGWSSPSPANSSQEKTNLVSTFNGH